MIRSCKLQALVFVVIFWPNSWGYSQSGDENQRFRSIFATIAGGKYTHVDLSRMLLKEPDMPAEFMVWNEQPGSFFDLMGNHLKNFGPEDLFERSLEEGFRVIPNLESDVQRSSASKITLILIPGFLSEFIDQNPFQSILDQGGDFELSWKRAVNLAPAEVASDLVFSLGDLGYEPRSLKDLVRVGQINHPDGSGFIQYLYLKSPAGSLETIMNLKDRARLTERRLKKILQILPDPGSVYLMGYSLGGNTALQILSDLPAEDKSGSELRVAGYIGLGAPAWGTSMTDISEIPGTGLFEVKNGLKDVVRQIEAPSGARWYQIPGMIVADFLILKNEVLKLRRLLLQLPSEAEGASDLQNEGAGGLHGGSAVYLLKNLLINQLKIQFLVADYLNFKSRIKIVADNFLKTIEGLSPSSRMLWWKHHTLPTNLRYLTISGVMHDKESDSERGFGTRFMGPQTQDFQMLRQSYQLIKDHTGLSLNDSQVSLHRSKLWPLLHRNLNPLQGNYQVANLGVVGSHHWGMSFPIAFKMQSGNVNPFPRELLLKSLGYYLLSQPGD